MFILVFFLVVFISQFATNKLLNISDDNAVGYSYSKKQIFILLGLFVLAIIFNKLPIKDKPKLYWILIGLYAFGILLTMVIFGTIKKVIITKQREELQQVFDVLEPVLPKNTELDMNNPPFKLGYEETKINKITIKINPNTFKEAVAVNLCLSLNKYLPNYEWVNEFDFAARECSFVGTPLPPSVARYQGSWLRPAEFIPIGLSGLGEVSWTINGIKDTGRSNYVYEDGKVAKTVDSPSAPQALAVGSPLGIDTIIPTTKGYKTMGTIISGDFVFDLDGNPVEVLKVHQIHKSTKTYELYFIDLGQHRIKIISDEIHKFPKTNDGLNYCELKCEDLKVGDLILGNQSTFILCNKKEIDNQLVRCITVNSDSHLFLITDKENSNWTGGDKYTDFAVATRNTGGGKSIYVEQLVELKDD